MPLQKIALSSYQRMREWAMLLRRFKHFNLLLSSWLSLSDYVVSALCLSCFVQTWFANTSMSAALKEHALLMILSYATFLSSPNSQVDVSLCLPNLASQCTSKARYSNFATNSFRFPVSEFTSVKNFSIDGTITRVCYFGFPMHLLSFRFSRPRNFKLNNDFSQA